MLLGSGFMQIELVLRTSSIWFRVQGSGFRVEIELADISDSKNCFWIWLISL